ncbi:MAG: hypothetical protein GWN01_15330 [Nitrosopumilaceae archaeon]|nr:hypothetical protein [Nitrosopumilaceae archaeon]NIU87498.1 hypothetical protein [Nitrosopumilaceae archaeon]NIX62815.1 hypothetical protein [Nitrosopumilaceae archaeon]
MGAPLLEFTLETVLRDGLSELRLNPDRLDDIFSKFLKTYFNNQYGQAKIDELKTWVTQNQIKIVHAKSQIPVQVPCISIQTMRTDEEESLQQFSDMYEEVDTNITPNVIVSNVIPTSYDTVSGKLSIDNTVDLSEVCPGYIFVDNSDNEFEIQSGNSNISGNKFINIGKGKTPDLGGSGRIESFLDFKRTERRMIRLRETIAIGCHTKNQVHLTKFLFALVYYVLKSRSDVLEQRKIQVSRGDTSIFDMEEQFENELVFSRYIQMTCITQFDWNQAEVNLIDCFDATIYAEDEDGKFKTNTSEDS